MASPSKQVKACAVPTCTTSFSLSDAHLECYYHRKCAFTREPVVPDGRRCKVCSIWSPDEIDVFMLRRAKRLRGRAARSVTDSLKKKPKLSSFSLQDRKKATAGVGSARPPFPQTLSVRSPGKSYAEAAAAVPGSLELGPVPLPLATPPPLERHGAANLSPRHLCSGASALQHSVCTLSQAAAPQRHSSVESILVSPVPVTLETATSMATTSSTQATSPYKPLLDGQLRLVQVVGLAKPADSDNHGTLPTGTPALKDAHDSTSVPSQLANPEGNKLDIFLAAFRAEQAANAKRFQILETALLAKPQSVDTAMGDGNRAMPQHRGAAASQPKPSVGPSRRNVTICDVTTGMTAGSSYDQDMQTTLSPELDMDDYVQISTETIQSDDDYDEGDYSHSPRDDSSQPLHNDPDYLSFVARGAAAHLQQLPGSQGLGVDQQELAKAIEKAVAQVSRTTASQRLRSPPQVMRTTLSPRTGLPRQASARGLSKTIPKKQESRRRSPSPNTRRQKQSVLSRGRSPGRRSHMEIPGVRARDQPRSLSPSSRRHLLESPSSSDRDRQRRRRSPSPRREPTYRSRSPRGATPDQHDRSRSYSHTRSRETSSERERSRSLTPRSRVAHESPQRDEDEEEQVQSFRKSVKALLASGIDIQQAESPKSKSYPKGRVSGQLGRPERHSTLLPPHPYVREWFDFSEDSLKEASSKKGTPFNCPSLRRTATLYNTGKEGKFLQEPRVPPTDFKQLSSFSTQEQVTRQATQPLTLSSASVKAIEKNVRVGLAASSYAAHFLDGVDHAFIDLQEKVRTLAPPPEASSNTKKTIDKQKEDILPLMAQMQTFLERTRCAMFDSIGSLATVDVNVTLAQRDRYVSKLRPYLVRHTTKLRHATCMSEKLLPNVEEISVLARDDAAQESTRQVATHLDDILPRPGRTGRGKSQSSYHSGNQGGNRNRSQSTRGRQPFRSAGRQTGRSDEPSSFGTSSTRGGRTRGGKRKWQKSKPDKSK